MGTVTIYKHDGSALRTLYHTESITAENGVLTVLYKRDPSDKVATKIKTTLPFYIEYDEEIAI